MKHDFVIYAIDAKIAEEAAALRQNLRQRGWQLGIIDAFPSVKLTISFW